MAKLNFSLRPEILEALQVTAAIGALVDHIHALCCDDYLDRHPEWAKIVRDAMVVDGHIKRPTAGALVWPEVTK